MKWVPTTWKHTHSLARSLVVVVVVVVVVRSRLLWLLLLLLLYSFRFSVTISVIHSTALMHTGLVRTMSMTRSTVQIHKYSHSYILRSTHTIAFSGQSLEIRVWIAHRFQTVLCVHNHRSFSLTIRLLFCCLSRSLCLSIFSIFTLTYMQNDIRVCIWIPPQMSKN